MHIPQPVMCGSCDAKRSHQVAVVLYGGSWSKHHRDLGGYQQKRQSDSSHEGLAGVDMPIGIDRIVDPPPRE
jgi:hypothetical protein